MVLISLYRKKGNTKGLKHLSKMTIFLFWNGGRSALRFPGRRARPRSLLTGSLLPPGCGHGGRKKWKKVNLRDRVGRFVPD